MAQMMANDRVIYRRVYPFIYEYEPLGLDYDITPLLPQGRVSPFVLRNMIYRRYLERMLGYYRRAPWFAISAGNRILRKSPATRDALPRFSYPVYGNGRYTPIDTASLHRYIASHPIGVNGYGLPVGYHVLDDGIIVGPDGSILSTRLGIAPFRQSYKLADASNIRVRKLPPLPSKMPALGKRKPVMSIPTPPRSRIPLSSGRTSPERMLRKWTAVRGDMTYKALSARPVAASAKPKSVGKEHFVTLGEMYRSHNPEPSRKAIRRPAPVSRPVIATTLMITKENTISSPTVKLTTTSSNDLKTV